MENGSNKDNLMNEIKNEKINSNVNLVKNIRSLYNIKQILSFLSEKKKLSMIIYNKNIQIKY